MFHFKNSSNIKVIESEKCQRYQPYWFINGTLQVSLQVDYVYNLLIIFEWIYFLIFLVIL